MLKTIQSIEFAPIAASVTFNQILLGIFYFLPALKSIIFRNDKFLTDSLLKSIAKIKRAGKERLGETIEEIEFEQVNLSDQMWMKITTLFPHLTLLKITDQTLPPNFLSNVLKLKKLQTLILRKIKGINPFEHIEPGAFKYLNVIFLEEINVLTRNDIKRIMNEAKNLFFLKVVSQKDNPLFVEDIPYDTKLTYLKTTLKIFRSYEDVERLLKITSLQNVVIQEKNPRQGQLGAIFDEYVAKCSINVTIEQGMDDLKPTSVSGFAQTIGLPS